MKTLAFVLIVSTAIVAFASSVSAQEAIPLEEAQSAAKKLNAALSWREEPVLRVTPDLEKPSGLKGGKGGGLLVPESTLTVESIQNAGETPSPVGQLWMLNVDLAPDGARTARDTAKYVSVGDGEKTREVRLYLLGVRKTEPDKLELVIYGTGREPVVTLPIEAVSSASADTPLKLSAESISDAQAKATIGILGKYRAVVTVEKDAD